MWLYQNMACQNHQGSPAYTQFPFIWNSIDDVPMCSFFQLPVQKGMVCWYCWRSFGWRYFHWPAIEEKCWVSVEHKLQLLSILSVNTSGWHYTFLENELKDTQKQLTENIWTWNYSSMHLPIEICSSFLNNLIIIGNFRKHLT